MRTVHLLILSFLALCASVQGQATYCVRAGASGSGNGSDWNNAFASLPATLQRGATYYVADGSYGNYTFDDAANGTSRITLKKATETSHGTETGWNSTFGDGQAVLGSLVIKTQYYVIDGQTRTETTRLEAPAGYGFRVAGISANSLENQNAAFSEFRYLDVGGTWNDTNSPDPSAPQQALYFVYNQNNITFTRCVFHNAGVGNGAIGMMHGSRDITWDHCDFYMGWGKSTLASPNAVPTRWTVKHCRFWNSSRRDTSPSAEGPGITCEVGSYSVDENHEGHLIYGNIFYGTASGGRNGCIMFGEPLRSGQAQNIKVFNNTFVGFPEASVLGEIYLRGGAGNEARNNLFYSTQSARVVANSASNNVTAASNPFVDFNARDFRLAAPISGTSLSSPYNVDPKGDARGSDGTWDVGAYEYGNSGPVAPTFTTQPSDVTVSAGETATFSVAAAGSQPLSFQWQRNGQNINGATSSSYTTPATVVADSGATFRVIVTNSVGSATSSSATLTVTGPVAPAITNGPSNATVAVGQPASFTVTASGSQPMTFQWQRSGANISGATQSTYTIGSVTTSDNGATFRVIVTNGAGTITSGSATLTVTSTPQNTAPTVALTQPSAGASATAPANISFSATASDSDGSIARVEFYNGATKLGEVTAAPYNWTWSNVQAGAYTLSAKAVDNLGAISTSSSVALTVTAPPADGLAVGDRVMVNIDPSLRVRTSPQLAATIVGSAPYHEVGTVVAGPVVADGFTFYQVNYDSTSDGWSIRGDASAPWLVRVTTPPPKAPSGLRIISN
jgi:hypothetical protein